MGIDYTRISAAAEITIKIVRTYRAYYFLDKFSYITSTGEASRY